MPGGLCYLTTAGNSVQKNSTDVHLLSSCFSMGNGITLLPRDSWSRGVALYAARKLIQDHWTNHDDEYLRPDESSPGYGRWVDDCHVYALLHNKNNCTAMRDVAYKGKSWRIKNHWFWRTRESALDLYGGRSSSTHALYHDAEAEPANESDDVLGLGTTEPWEETGDPYLAHVLPSLDLSPAARRVLDLLDALLVKSLPLREDFARARPELHLLAWDAGVYQLKHLWREHFPDDWEALQAAFRVLSDVLRPGVYGFGFLKNPAVFYGEEPDAQLVTALATTDGGDDFDSWWAWWTGDMA